MKVVKCSISASLFFVSLSRVSCLEIFAQRFLYHWLGDEGSKVLYISLLVLCQPVESLLPHEHLPDVPRLGGDLYHGADNLVGLGQTRLSVLHDLVHQPDAKGLVCGEEGSKLEGELGLALAHGVEHRVLEPEGSHDPQQRLVEANGELRSLHHAVVTAQGQQTPARRAVTRDGGGCGQLVAVELYPHVLEAGPELPEPHRVGLVHFSDLEAGAEHGVQ